MGRPDHKVGSLGVGKSRTRDGMVASNFDVEIVGKCVGDSIPASHRNHQALYLLAICPHLCAEPGQEVLVPASFHMGQYVILHSRLLRHYLSMHTSSQDLES